MLLINMSNNNTSNNTNLVQTSLNDAYYFSSFSAYINNNGLKPIFSPKCIFCTSNNSIPLVNDGSFRQCNSCKKQFKSLLVK